MQPLSVMVRSYAESQYKIARQKACSMLPKMRWNKVKRTRFIKDCLYWRDLLRS